MAKTLAIVRRIEGYPPRLLAIAAPCVLLVVIELSLSMGVAHATDCPPGNYADCVATVGSVWNPLVPVIGAIAGAGIAGLFARPPAAGPIKPPVTKLQLERPVESLQTSSSPPSAPPDYFPEQPVQHVTMPSLDREPEAPPPPLPQGPINLPEWPLAPRLHIDEGPTMQEASTPGVTTDGGRVRMPAGSSRPLGGLENDGLPGDGRYEDAHGNPLGVPSDFVKTGEVVTHTALPPGLRSSGNPILDEVFYSGSDTLPGTGIPGTPSTVETSDPRVKYKQITYENPRTNTRYTYNFYRNEGPLSNPFIDEGTYRLTGPPKISKIPR